MRRPHDSPATRHTRATRSQGQATRSQPLSTQHHATTHTPERHQRPRHAPCTETRTTSNTITRTPASTAHHCPQCDHPRTMVHTVPHCGHCTHREHPSTRAHLWTLVDTAHHCPQCEHLRTLARTVHMRRHMMAHADSAHTCGHCAHVWTVHALMYTVQALGTGIALTMSMMSGTVMGTSTFRHRNPKGRPGNAETTRHE